MTARHQKIFATLTLTLTLTAVLVSSAQATDRPDNRAGTHGIGPQNTKMSDVFTRAVARAGLDAQNADMSDVFTRAVARTHTTQTVRPDDRAGIRGAARITPMCQASAPVPSLGLTPTRPSGRTTGPASAAPAPSSPPPHRLQRPPRKASNGQTPESAPQQHSH